MVNYECYRCGYTNNHKATFVYHLKRKHMCVATLSDMSTKDIYNHYFKKKNNSVENEIAQKDSIITQKDSILTQKDSILLINCEHCHRSFKRKNNLTRHEKTCKIKKEKILVEQLKKDKKILENIIHENHKVQKEILKERDQILKEKEKEKDKIIKEVRKMFEREFEKKLKEAISDPNFALTTTSGALALTNSHNVNSLNNTTNVITVNLNSYDKTDYSHIKDKDYLECIRKGNMGIPYLIEKLHFNPDKPENFNIFISNIKSDYIKVYENGRWNTKLQYEAINMMVQDNANIIEDKIEEWYDKKHEYSKKKYKDILDKYPRFLNRLSDSKYVGKKVEEEVKLVLFNLKDMVLNNNKRLKLKD